MKRFVSDPAAASVAAPAGRTQAAPAQTPRNVASPARQNGTLRIGGHPVVLALGGASGYLPEDTLEATAFAHALGADAVVVSAALTQDDQLVVVPDNRLDLMTDVAARFPRRARSDRRYYVSDFSLKEILTLSVFQRIEMQHPRVSAGVHFPPAMGNFRLATLEDHIELIQGLNHSTGRTAGVHVVLVPSARPGEDGSGLCDSVLGTLARFGYQGEGDRAAIICPCAVPLRNLRSKTNLRIVCTLDSSGRGGAAPSLKDALQALDEASSYFSVCAPRIEYLVEPVKASGDWTITTFGEEIRARGIVLCPLISDSRADEHSSTADMLRHFIFEGMNAEGVYSGFPDRILNWLHSTGRRKRGVHL